ncbi:hypothetical protein VPG91_09425, partial [Nitrospirillum amazonense]
MTAARRLASVEATQRAVKLEAFSSWSAHSTRAMRTRSAPSLSSFHAWAHCLWMGAALGAVPSRQAVSSRASAAAPCASRPGARCQAAVSA